ncbi:trypsin-like peptidase domain-containing protein [Streptomyces sp. AV19]|uniref:VMAP-C domain-containing protein n=1 Tax=Streptomyces sp. AV19 TaxID=2793068 RepID=UPI0018FE0654|nr:trypsin-like peptidase domain-containing protein [Streptomyces sp. AV19]MBH1933609.1 trypsin-like peptidase domain-containing protein [Streptomyces sp. AV19]MDG4535885.1 trypsin-like peptidase domain-containing protein [Streptomyces sp. AV19]
MRRSVVRISAPGAGQDDGGGRFWGSGFFIAPGRVLTCAHVVAMGGGGVLEGGVAFDVTDWRERTLRGRVVLALPPPRPGARPPDRWPLPDLALVEVEDAADAECLWLSDRSAVVPAPVALYGWSRETGELGWRYGTGTAAGGDGSGGAMLLRGEIPVAGCSGGPVVDTGRGAVIGVSKGRGEGTAGLAVPVTALRAVANERPGRERLHALVRAHDRYHLRHYRAIGAGRSWTGLQKQLRGPVGGFAPVLRTQLFARLAELTQPAGPGEVMTLVDEVKSRVLQDPYQPGVEHDPRTWREGVGLLYDLRDGTVDRAERVGGPPRDLELEAVLLYAARVAAAVSRLGHAADAKPLSGLADWLVIQADEVQEAVRKDIHRLLHGGSAGSAEPDRRPAGDKVSLDKVRFGAVESEEDGGRARADVLVEIDPTMYGDLYPWRIKLLGENNRVTPLCDDVRGVPRAALRETLREPIAEALRQSDVGEHLAALQVVLPRELFDEPVASWRLTPPGAGDDSFDPHALPLGQRRVVVVRDRRRRDHPAFPEWHTRWRGAGRGPMTAVRLRDEVPVPGHAARRKESRNAAYARFLETDPSAVPVYCGPVSHGPGATALEAALTAGHAVVIWRCCTGEHDDCEEFHEQASRLVCEATTVEGLHRRLRSLRIRCADPEAPDEDARWAQSIALLMDSPEDPGLAPPPLTAPGPRPGEGA